MLTANVAQNAVAFVSRFSVAGTGEEQISELFASALTSSPREGQSVLGRAAKAPIDRPNSSRTIQQQPEYEAFFASATSAQKERQEKKRSSAPLSLSSLKGEVLLARLAPPASSEEHKVKLSKRGRAHLFPHARSSAQQTRQKAHYSSPRIQCCTYNDSSGLLLAPRPAPGSFSSFVQMVSP